MGADERGARPGRTPALLAMRGWQGWALTSIALVVVLTMIVIGAVRITSGPGSAVPIAEPAESVATGTDPVALPFAFADPAEPAVFLVDLPTARTRSLPGHVGVDRAGEFQVSPDRTRFAFTGPGEEGDPRQVYLADVDGVGARLVTSAFAKSSPRWSPDGTQVVYDVTDARVAVDVFVVDAAATRPSRKTERLVAHASASEFWQVGANPSFSADGRSILFTMMPADDHMELRLVPATGGHSEPLIEGAAYGSFSPDGRTIAYQRMIPDGDRNGFWPRNDGIWLADADGSHRRPLFGPRGFQVAPLAWKRLGPSWSPDGTRIAFLRPSDGKIYVADVAGGTVTPVAPGAGAAWFDDDTLIIEGFGRPLPRVAHADLAGNWFAFVDGRPTYLLLGTDGRYYLEDSGGPDSQLDGSGDVEISGDTVRLVADGRPGGCPHAGWTLEPVSLVQPDRMAVSGSTSFLCEWPETSFRRLGAWPSAPERWSNTSGSAQLTEGYLAGTWVDESGDTVYRYGRDGSFAYYWADADFWHGFQVGEGGRWQLRHGQLRIMYEGGRTCPGPDGVMSVFNMYSDRAHRVEVRDIDAIGPRAMSQLTVKDRCYDAVGDGGVQLRLFP